MSAPVFSMENIHRQYLRCRRNKRNTINALRFEYNLEDNLWRLQQDLSRRTYVPSRSVCFVVDRPKLREIFAADFRDRVVHHLLVDVLERVFEPRFIFDSYACRRNKGTHRAVDRLQSFMRRESRNNTRPAAYMQLDVSGFFFNIDKQILYDLVRRKINDEDMLWLTGVIIFHDCTEGAAIKGNRRLFRQIPPHKTLFGTRNLRGLPIGNLTSQFFANVYLNELDQFVKHRLKARHYLRYCDDTVLLDADPGRLREWRGAILDFLREHLRLELNDRREREGMVQNGVDFLGYIVRPDYRLVRRRVVNRFKSTLLGFERQFVSRQGDGVVRLSFSHGDLLQLASSWASYMAHLDKADSFRLKASLFRRFWWLPFFSAFETRDWS